MTKMFKVCAITGLFLGAIGAGTLYYANQKLDTLVLDLANSVEQQAQPHTKSGNAAVVAKGSEGQESNVKPGTGAGTAAPEQAKAATSKAKGAGTGAKAKKAPSVDTSDKAKVIDMVTSKLPSSAIQELKALARGGATPENIAQAKRILKAHLSAADIEELRRIARKYKVK